jgi:integrase
LEILQEVNVNGGTDRKGIHRRASRRTRSMARQRTLLRGRTPRGTTRTVKAVRNIIDWHFRSLWRDAESEGYAGPFPSLDWPRVQRLKPDPFDAEERDALLGWFAQNDLYWCSWLFFLFSTGMRHGEAAALRWHDIDLKRNIISISRSRDSGEDNALKNGWVGARDSYAAVGYRSLEADAATPAFRWF